MSPENYQQVFFLQKKPCKAHKEKLFEIEKCRFQRPVAPKSKQENPKQTEHHRKNPKNLMFPKYQTTPCAGMISARGPD